MVTNMVNEVDIKKFLKSISIFSDLNKESVDRFVKFGKLVKYKKGQVVFFQFDPSDKFYLVRSGVISILIGSSDGREMVINEIRSGDFFGELGILTNQPRSTGAVARTNCEVFVFPRQIFLDLLDQEPRLSRRILNLTADRLRISSEREGALAFLDAQTRLARLLLQMEELELEKGYLTISQEELASRTGLTRQTAAKILGRWRRFGWLVTGRGHIVLINHKEISNIGSERILF